MTNFQRDLIRYLETTEDGDFGTIANGFFYGEYFGEYPPEVDSWENMNVSFEFIAHYGGEDQGSEYWSVYKFTDNATGEEVYIKFDGWYASYDGANFEECLVVQPKEKTVVVYE